ncbi:hypothetical protein GOODEAATRI_016174 [Goodea atripinnis]|uniref:Receptor ligand binding region domain-containing protein n=1 Tax=Goodea atripinnis TaxID=208336 RepID=A0ABV0NKP9_9TELE
MEGYGHAYIGPFNPTLCHAASLFAQHWEAGLASPGCLDADWLNLSPITSPAKVLITVLRFFRWAHVAVISGEDDHLEGIDNRSRVVMFLIKGVPKITPTFFGLGPKF